MESELLDELLEDDPNAAVETPMAMAITVPNTFARRPHVMVVTGLPLFGAACIPTGSVRMRAITFVSRVDPLKKLHYP
jgi:hypothetical protein